MRLWFLGTKVDVGFLYGNLHHRGGILFSSISLSILAGSLYTLRKVEHRAYRGTLRPLRIENKCFMVNPCSFVASWVSPSLSRPPHIVFWLDTRYPFRHARQESESTARGDNPNHRLIGGDAIHRASYHRTATPDPAVPITATSLTYGEN